jgi:hypothetical protein
MAIKILKFCLFVLIVIFAFALGVKFSGNFSFIGSSNKDGSIIATETGEDDITIDIEDKLNVKNQNVPEATNTVPSDNSNNTQAVYQDANVSDNSTVQPQEVGSETDIISQDYLQNGDTAPTVAPEQGFQPMQVDGYSPTQVDEVNANVGDAVQVQIEGQPIDPSNQVVPAQPQIMTSDSIEQQEVIPSNNSSQTEEPIVPSAPAPSNDSLSPAPTNPAPSTGQQVQQQVKKPSQPSQQKRKK